MTVVCPQPNERAAIQFFQPPPQLAIAWESFRPAGKNVCMRIFCRARGRRCLPEFGARGWSSDPELPEAGEGRGRTTLRWNNGIETLRERQTANFLHHVKLPVVLSFKESNPPDKLRAGASSRADRMKCDAVSVEQFEGEMFAALEQRAKELNEKLIRVFL